jgi:phospholipase/lecithinase/hemolysin
VATITVREIAYKDLEIYLQENLPQVAKDLSEADFKSALTKIQDSANRFGLWDTVQRICNTTRDEANDQPITLNIIASVISLVERIRR